MKIDYALMSCDINPMYIDFIPVITYAPERGNLSQLISSCHLYDYTPKPPRQALAIFSTVTFT